jgi:hypothetical protein
MITIAVIALTTVGSIGLVRRILQGRRHRAFIRRLHNQFD